MFKHLYITKFHFSSFWEHFQVVVMSMSKLTRSVRSKQRRNFKFYVSLTKCYLELVLIPYLELQNNCKMLKFGGNLVLLLNRVKFWIIILYLTYGREFLNKSWGCCIIELASTGQQAVAVFAKIFLWIWRVLQTVLSGAFIATWELNLDLTELVINFLILSWPLVVTKFCIVDYRRKDTGSKCRENLCGCYGC